MKRRDKNQELFRNEKDNNEKSLMTYQKLDQWFAISSRQKILYSINYLLPFYILTQEKTRNQKENKNSLIQILD